MSEPSYATTSDETGKVSVTWVGSQPDEVAIAPSWQQDLSPAALGAAVARLLAEGAEPEQERVARSTWQLAGERHTPQHRDPAAALSILEDLRGLRREMRSAAARAVEIAKERHGQEERLRPEAEHLANLNVGVVRQHGTIVGFEFREPWIENVAAAGLSTALTDTIRRAAELPDDAPPPPMAQEAAEIRQRLDAVLAEMGLARLTRTEETP